MWMASGSFYRSKMKGGSAIGVGRKDSTAGLVAGMVPELAKDEAEEQ
jgi:hypothetical protein